jgi:hypothetical protein
MFAPNPANAINHVIKLAGGDVTYRIFRLKVRPALLGTPTRAAGAYLS